MGARLARCGRCCVANPRLATSLVPHAEQGDDAHDEGGEEEPEDGAPDRDLVRQPQHGCSHVPHGAPSAACIGGDDNQAADGVTQVSVLAHRVAEQLQADDGGREVVDDRAHEEAQHAEDRQQGLLAPLGPLADHVGDNCEAVEVVNGLNHAHGGEEEQDDATDFLEPVVEFVLQRLVPFPGGMRVIAHREEGPHRGGHDEHDRGLVDADVVLQHDEDQADQEEDGHQGGLQVLVVDPPARPAEERHQEDGGHERGAHNLQAAPSRKAGLVQLVTQGGPLRDQTAPLLGIEPHGGGRLRHVVAACGQPNYLARPGLHASGHVAVLYGPLDSRQEARAKNVWAKRP
mmetsp:Transcript_82639/g.212890  ORF Transcript_82639/g.212890 Transcript_82639/m.212890 type:complete len:345 (+) Transcript_82639:3-1037(+)